MSMKISPISICMTFLIFRCINLVGQQIRNDVIMVAVKECKDSLSVVNSQHIRQAVKQNKKNLDILFWIV